MIIGGKQIGDNAPVFIIAEAGVNHNGDVSLAKQLIDIAVDAQADAVKFQSFITEDLIIDSVPKASYQKKTTDASQTQFDMLKALEMRINQMQELKAYCDQKNIFFLSTPFDEASLEELDKLNVETYKISSTDTTNLLFLKKVAKKGKPVILSSGMCYLFEVEAAVNTLKELNTDLVLLQCTSNYPVADEEVNLNVLDLYREKFDCIIGFSDHTPGIGASPYAVAKGARVIEKHFTIDKEMEGPDHKASLSPEELKQFVKEIRRVEKFLGSKEKKPTAGEINTRLSLQKCFVARERIEQGGSFTEENIVAKRTGGVGISALNPDKILGKLAIRTFERNEIIEIS